jgi:hypothetical protein
MEFGTVVIVVAIVAVVIAALSYRGSGRIYSGLGREGGLDMTREPSGPAPSSGAEVQEEIRQMLEAKSARRQARGQPAIDVEAELAELTRPAAGADPGLREEIRQLVIARNERRLRQGKEPVDVDEEIERQLRELGA